MKSLFIVALLLVSIVGLHAGDIIDVDEDNFDHEQDGAAGQSVTGEYKWESPEGEEFVVRYVADSLGYRVLESNAVPVNSDGERADGAQGDLDGDSNEDK